MKMAALIQCALCAAALCVTSIAEAYQHAVLQPIRWQGKKWEYLIEHPTKQLIDPPLFEEILDTAGLYGWQLIEITDTAHFYVFYFKRPLLPHKLETQMYRLAHVKHSRQLQEAPVRERVHQEAVTTQEQKAMTAITTEQDKQSFNSPPPSSTTSTAIPAPAVQPATASTAESHAVKTSTAPTPIAPVSSAPARTN